MLQQLFIALFFSLVLSQESAMAQPNDTLTYIFLGHIYQSGGDWKRVDFRLETLDMSQYDRIWLGGDIASEADLEYENLTYLDSLFDLDKPENHWALGNHDTRNHNMEWIKEITGRPGFYAYSKHSITTIVLDGNISPLDCENLNKQYDLIKSVCDTISSGYLIFLVHHGLATDIPGVPDPINYAHNQAKNWLPNCYSDTATYANAIYPMLVDAESRGVEVMHIMGDTGSWYKFFHATSNEGVDYFAAGLGNGYKLLNGQPTHAPDKALVFKHVLSTNQLTWSFVNVNDL